LGCGLSPDLANRRVAPEESAQLEGRQLVVVRVESQHVCQRQAALFCEQL